MKHNFCQCAIDEVVVNDVDEIESFFALLKEIDRFLIACFVSVFVDFNFVNGSPDVNEGGQSFVFPQFESLMVDNSWLDDFSTFENAPCDSIDVIIFDILESLALQVNGLVRNIFIFIKMLN